MNDEQFMRLALELARKGEGTVNPNPLVGSVVVKDGTIVGQGHHQAFGGPHAEAVALEQSRENAHGATLYVSLEPCCYRGKTPPCTQQISDAGIVRVVVACRDPNPLVNGKGIARLQEAGIAIKEGVLAAEAQRINEIFFKFIATRLPFVQIKLAMSLDGKIATQTGESRWISGERSRIAAHKLRRKFSAVLVGVGTVLSDDPQLTVRHVRGRDPIRIVLDGEGKIPLTAGLLHKAGRTIVATAAMTKEKETELLALGVEVWRFPDEKGNVDLQALMTRLGETEIDSVLVEGGGETVASFLEAELVDKVSFFVAPMLLGGRNAVPAVGGTGVKSISNATQLRNIDVERIGEDILICAYPEWKTG